jgi:hypothetical protein
METERLTGAHDPRVLRIITVVFYLVTLFTLSTRESNEPYPSVYVKEFEGATWVHASMRPNLGVFD